MVVGLGKGLSVCQTYLPLKDVLVSCHIICSSLKTLDLCGELIHLLRERTLAVRDGAQTYHVPRDTSPKVTLKATEELAYDFF